MVFFKESNIFLPFLELTLFWFMARKMYWAKTYFLQKNNENLLVATEKTGHEVNSKNPERIFTLCEENVEECHKIKVSNRFLCGHNPKKPNPHSQINRGHFKLGKKIVAIKTSIFLSARSLSKNSTTNIHRTIILSVAFHGTNLVSSTEWWKETKRYFNIIHLHYNNNVQTKINQVPNYYTVIHILIKNTSTYLTWNTNIHHQEARTWVVFS